jgi:tetratricopeptide (TPR) repeat protein
MDAELKGLSLLGAGEFNLAREVFQHILKEPSVANAQGSSESKVQALLGLGLCDKAQNFLQPAAHHFESAVEACPNVAAIENLIDIYGKLGEAKKLQAAAEKGLKLTHAPSSLKEKYLGIVNSSAEPSEL